jgi:hypothetical protein
VVFFSAKLNFMDRNAKFAQCNFCPNSIFYLISISKKYENMSFHHPAISDQF